MKFYTDIGRNVSILNNLKIKKNGIRIYLYKRLQKLKIKYEMNFNEK